MHRGWPCGTLNKNARQRGITHFLEFLEENKQEHLTFQRKKTFTQQGHQGKRLSPGKSWPVCLISLVKAHGTKISSLASEERERTCGWGTDPRKSWLTRGQLPSQLHAKDFNMWAVTSEHHTETTWEIKPENYLRCGNQAWKCAVKTYGSHSNKCLLNIRLHKWSLWFDRRCLPLSRVPRQLPVQVVLVCLSHG